MKKINTFTYPRTDGTTTTVDKAYETKMCGREVVIHRPSYDENGWCVSDKASGLRISSEYKKTREEAFSNAVFMLMYNSSRIVL